MQSCFLWQLLRQKHANTALVCFCHWATSRLVTAAAYVNTATWAAASCCGRGLWGICGTVVKVNLCWRSWLVPLLFARCWMWGSVRADMFSLFRCAGSMGSGGFSAQERINLNSINKHARNPSRNPQSTLSLGHPMSPHVKEHLRQSWT